MGGTPSDSGQDHKVKRYDRQLRIWGADGQRRLESCRVALLNCGPTGSETLKNLVLGGIGSFTVVDGAKVSAADLGNNFLVDEAGLGDSRAKVVTALLGELNDGVAGSYVEETPEALVAAKPDFFEGFDLVIATQMRESDLLKLEAICRAAGVTLLVVRSYGLVGTMRASAPQHCVTDSKPDSQVEDLRLTAPWPELEAFAASFDLEALDSMGHKHVPYAVLLLQALSAWRSSHGGALPSNSKERAAFKESIRAMKRKVEHVGIDEDEENFEEAIKAAFHAWTPASVPSEVAALMASEAATPHPGSTDFWVLVAALKAFVAQEGCGCLPLEGSIPDMHATTDSYLALQRVYREQAERHVAALEAHVQSILRGLGRPADSISYEAVRHFARNARNLRVVTYRTLAEETSPDTAKGAALHAALSAEHTAGDASLHVLLRASDRFHATYGHYPGSFDTGLEDDAVALKNIANQLLAEAGVSGVALSQDHVTEVCRCGAGELHCIAAIMGGMAAQEAIKLVTQQFVPFAGVLVYNGIAATTTLLDL